MFFQSCSLTSGIVGDFGLATSSLAAVDPSDVSPQVAAFEADMTLGKYFISCGILVLTLHRGRNTIIYCSGSPVKKKRAKKSLQSGHV